MSLRGYVKKGKPALWKQAADDAGVVDHFALARQQYKAAKAERKKLEASFGRLKRSPKQRRRIAPMSEAGRKRLDEYKKARAEYLRDCPFCEVCVEISKLTDDGLLVRQVLREHEATDIHHVRGRLGPLLTDRRYFKATCSKSHRWIHANVTLARALGLLAQPGEWNRPN